MGLEYVWDVLVNICVSNILDFSPHLIFSQLSKDLGILLVHLQRKTTSFAILTFDRPALGFIKQH